MGFNVGAEEIMEQRVPWNLLEKVLSPDQMMVWSIDTVVVLLDEMITPRIERMSDQCESWRYLSDKATRMHYHDPVPI